MIRSDLLFAGGVALAVTLGVNYFLPDLRGAGSGLITGPVAEVFVSAADFGLMRGANSAAPVGQEEEGPVFCEPDVAGFVEDHQVDDSSLKKLPIGSEGLKETTILTPSRMNSYGLTEAPEYFVGYFAQRGSFESTLFNDVGHIEVLTTYILRDPDIDRRNLTDSIRRGTGPTHGIFQVKYEQGGSLIGEWSGKTDNQGHIQGCFFFPPTRIQGKLTAGIGTYRQQFAQNETSIVTWEFEALYREE